MPQLRDLPSDQLPTSNSTVAPDEGSESTVAPDEGSESFQVNGSNPSAWGVWERLVPDEVAGDPTSQRMLELHLARYQTAAGYVVGNAFWISHVAQDTAVRCFASPMRFL